VGAADHLGVDDQLADRTLDVAAIGPLPLDVDGHLGEARDAAIFDVQGPAVVGILLARRFSLALQRHKTGRDLGEFRLADTGGLGAVQCAQSIVASEVEQEAQTDQRHEEDRHRDDDFQEREPLTPDSG